MSKHITDRHYPLPERQRCLTRKYAKIKPEGVLKNVVLYDHQCTIIAAMIDIETTRKFTLSNGDIVFSSSGLLSEPGGAGKTFICIGLIVSQKLPRPFPTIYGFDDPNSVSMAVTQKVTGAGALIQSTLVIAGTSVFKQWYHSISEHTNGAIATVSNHHEFCIFQHMLEAKVVSRYPIVLLRSATVSGTFEIDGVKHPNQARSSIDVMKMMTQKHCWGRIIIDDYDTIGIPHTAPTLNALFTWYVSASRKNQTHVVSRKDHALEAQIKETPTVVGATRCPMLHGLYNLRVSEKYRRASVFLPSIKFYKCVFPNPNDIYIRGLHGLNDEVARNMVQMLNGDATGEAAAALGIEATCVADIYEKFLGNQYKVFMDAKNQLAFLQEQREILDTLDEMEDQRQHSNEAIEKIKKRILRLKDPEVTYFSRKLEVFYEEMAVDLHQIVKKSGVVIERMVDNIRAGGCQVCKLDLDRETSVFIVKCCGLVICSICFPRACKLGLHYDRQVGQCHNGGKCAQCNQFIDLKKDIVFLDKKRINVETLATARGDEKATICGDCGKSPCICAELAAEAAEAATIEDQQQCACGAEDTADCTCKHPGDIKNLKVRALIQIIRGEVPDNRTEFERTNVVLMAGNEYVQQPQDVQKKVVVFAHYEETLDLVTEQLVAFGIKFLRIAGGADEVYDTLQRFEKGNYTVLLINSNQRCAGMDMPFVSDEVFMHEVLDKHVAGQLAARAQRCGRKYSLIIWYLCYENENLLM